MATNSRTLRVIGMTVGSLLMLGQTSGSFADSLPTSCDIESGVPSGFCASSTLGGIQAEVWRKDHDQDSSQQGNSYSTVGDQRALKTAEGAFDPAATPYKEPARCKKVYINKAPNSPTVSDDDTVDNCPLPADPEGGSDQDPGRVPTTRDILYMAATIIHADGAGLYKRPEGVSYTNKYIPSIVAVTSPTQTHVINLLGRDITITLTATSYEWSWGDGTPNLVTTFTGSVWQEGMDLNNDPRLIRHYYTPPQGWRSMLDGPYPHEDREITLTTTWSGTATNPFTGDTQTINGLVTTTETTGKFPLSHLVINNTDTWEEKQGH